MTTIFRKHYHAGALLTALLLSFSNAQAQLINVISDDTSLESNDAATSNTIAGFDALGGNKLVVTAAWESGTTSVGSITYGSQDFSSIGVIGTGAGRFFTIWYLDAPATGANDLTVNFSGDSTGSRIHVLSLSGAASGEPVATAIAGVSDSSSGIISVDLNIPEADTLAVGGYVENGSAAITGSLANEMYLGSSDSSSGWAGWQYESTAGLKTYSFTGVTNNSNGMAVAAFSAVPEPATSVLIFGLLGLGLIAMRRRLH
jgi:hypothetical protein